MLRIVFVLIGYAFGLFQTGYFLGKLTGRNLEKEGSGNTPETRADALRFCYRKRLRF